MLMLYVNLLTPNFDKAHLQQTVGMKWDGDEKMRRLLSVAPV
jgi:hypothetical protein